VAEKLKIGNLKKTLMHCSTDGMKLSVGVETDLFRERQNTQLSAKIVKAITPVAKETEKWTTEDQDKQAEKTIEESERLEKIQQRLGFVRHTAAGGAPAFP
jgi:hypothetical protein